MGIFSERPLDFAKHGVHRTGALDLGAGAASAVLLYPLGVSVAQLKRTVEDAQSIGELLGFAVEIPFLPVVFRILGAPTRRVCHHMTRMAHAVGGDTEPCSRTHVPPSLRCAARTPPSSYPSGTALDSSARSLPSLAARGWIVTRESSRSFHSRGLMPVRCSFDLLLMCEAPARLEVANCTHGKSSPHSRSMSPFTVARSHRARSIFKTCLPPPSGTCLEKDLRSAADVRHGTHGMRWSTERRLFRDRARLARRAGG